MSTLQPFSAPAFRFVSRHFDPATGVATLTYAFGEGREITETLVFPYAPWPDDGARQSAFFRALELLHLVAGVSYYKAALPQEIDCGGLLVDEALAHFLNQLYQQGLAEFAHVNELDLDGRIRFPAQGDLAPMVSDAELPERALVAMGGGKDSLVSLELLRQAGVEIQPICVGSSELIKSTVAAAGMPLIQIQRTLAPELAQMNEAGALNGHVPVTAINSAILVCAAFLYGYQWVVFSNEHSADEPTLIDAKGRPVNHQYSKSMAFEEAFRAVLHDRVSPGVEYFSLLRPMNEVAIAERFSELQQYHQVFSSCNRNFHLDGSRVDGRWCGDCPKCRFTTLALAVKLKPAELESVFATNLLNDPAQEEGFRALCALGMDKPFECVGSVDESRALLKALGEADDWKEMSVVASLIAELKQTDGPSLDELKTFRGAHFVPSELSHLVTA